TFHFTAAEEYRQRVIQMGEDPSRVFCVGAPGLDHLKRSQLLSREALEEKIGLPLRSPLFLVTYHPVTREKSTSGAHTQALLHALDAFPKATIVITGANADPDNAAIGELTVAYAHKHSDRMRHVVSLGSINYLSLLQYADVVIGNSSSGVIEVPAFQKATVNIGDRQKGRLMAESVISCPDDVAAIQQAITKALTPAFQKNLTQVQNPYGCGNASAQIKSTLKAATLDNVLKKEFHHI
ncbi:MAG: UDP-N-acetylglucosamine 2-epimerase, partial [Sideroxyarcus sp.]|nr:UDP-N-acetylglucosamine 2-epimerase [Sideroxyarcus sp.]